MTKKRKITKNKAVMIPHEIEMIEMLDPYRHRYLASAVVVWTITAVFAYAVYSLFFS